MPQFLKDYGERLVELGYTVLPIRPGTKRPDIKNWPDHATTAADVVKWYSNGRAQHGAGINARDTPAIDVDVMDREVADAMSDAIDAIFPGVTLLTRTGLAPKFLIPFRSDEPFRKLTSSVYTDGKHEHKIEILGDGQQWVAYHIHPDTDRPYQWFDGVSTNGISGTARAALPVLTRDDARRVIDAFEVLASGKVAAGQWLPKSVDRSHADAPRDSGADPFADQPVGKSDAEVAAILAKVPNDDAAYEWWFKVLASLHSELGDAGRELALEWSSSSSKHTDEKFDTTWNSLGRFTGRRAGLRTLMRAAKEAQPEHKPRATVSGNPFQIHDWADYKQDYLTTPWIIKGVLPQAEVGILYGQSGSGKTFFVLDLAATVARGAVWRGKKVNGCRVVYVAAEAREGIKKRLDAYDQHVCADGVRPAIIASAPNLLSSDATELADAIGSAGLIILDTMAASHSGDENSAKDMGLFLAACKDLSLATGAMVLAVHHTGKEESKGMRGSSALFAGADFVMEVFKSDKEHGAILSKSRDDASGVTFGFELQRVVVGLDPDGDEVTTCVVRTLDKEVTKTAKRPKKLANLEDSRYDMHREMLTIFERLTDESPSRTVSRDAIIEAVQRKFPSKLKRNLAVVLLKLVEMGVVTQNVDEYGLADDELESC